MKECYEGFMWDVFCLVCVGIWFKFEILVVMLVGEFKGEYGVKFIVEVCELLIVDCVDFLNVFMLGLCE